MYATTKQEAPAASDVVTGTFIILSHAAYILIDPSSISSFISYEFALKSHSTIEPLGRNLGVSMPAGGTIIVNMVVRACPIEVESKTLHADLVVINLKEFDVILGMD